VNGVLVILESGEKGWHRLSGETLAAGAEVARGVGQPLFAAAVASTASAIEPELGRLALDRAYAVVDDSLAQYTADGYTAALEQLIRSVDPAYVLLPHTYQARDFAPRLAARFGQMLIADAVALRVEDGRPVWVRQLLQGKLNGDYRHSGNGPCFASVQAGAFRADPSSSGTAPVERFSPSVDPTALRVKAEAPFRLSSHTVDLTAAPVIVSVGRGIKEKEYIPVVQRLAEALGAELAASRPICDNGWLPMERQVGSSGQTVSPKLYLAVGISGAIQHLVGMKGSKTIIAINKDASAPIFEVADYGVVGDLFEIVPALTLAARTVKAG
jgi:electron transfer flavoprotein alpha subunit